MGNAVNSVRKVGLPPRKEDNKKLKKKILKHLKIHKTKSNIVFVGKQFTGRTSLIEAILFGSEINKTLIDSINIYQTSALPNITFWETPQFSEPVSCVPKYYRQNCIRYLGTVIIVCQASLGEDEIKFYQQALKHRQKVIIVRSQCDVDLSNQKKRNAIEEVDQDAADNYVDDMSKKFDQAFAAAGMKDVTMFFVSAITIRDLMEENEPEIQFQEREFLNFLNRLQNDNDEIFSIILTNLCLST